MLEIAAADVGHDEVERMIGFETVAHFDQEWVVTGKKDVLF